MKTEFQWLTRYLQTLPEEVWPKPSACDDWEVRDVAGHLVLAAKFYSDVVSRGVRGDTSPSLLFSGIDATNRSTLAQCLSETAVDRRRNLREQLLPTFTTQWGRNTSCWIVSVPKITRNHVGAGVGIDLRGSISYWRFRNLPFIAGISVSISPTVSEHCLPILVERAVQRFRVATGLLDPLRASKKRASARYCFDVTGPVPANTIW